jgi:hypothetical protein
MLWVQIKQSPLCWTIQGEFEIRHNLKDLQEVNKPKMWLNILNL